MLVRRGYEDPGAARRFLDAELPRHDPLLLGDMAIAVERIHEAVKEGKRICVHGDYDVDGICATALATLLLRELGADVGWHLPSRFEEGYGISSDTLGRLADEGYGLVVTVDCGITAVDEIAEATLRSISRKSPVSTGISTLVSRRSAGSRARSARKKWRNSRLVWR